MKTLEQIMAEIESSSINDDIKRVTLTCGATHIAQDPNGAIYAYKGKPSSEGEFDEWMSEGEGGVVLFCADLEKPEDWTQCVWELP